MSLGGVETLGKADPADGSERLRDVNELCRGSDRWQDELEALAFEGPVTAGTLGDGKDPRVRTRRTEACYSVANKTAHGWTTPRETRWFAVTWAS